MRSRNRYISSRQVQKSSAPARDIGQAGHAALEGVAVEIGEAGNADPWRSSPADAATRARRGDRAVATSAARRSPSRRQQGGLEPQADVNLRALR
jgi:hypothetical protein